MRRIPFCNFFEAEDFVHYLDTKRGDIQSLSDWKHQNAGYDEAVALGLKYEVCDLMGWSVAVVAIYGSGKESF